MDAMQLDKEPWDQRLRTFLGVSHVRKLDDEINRRKAMGEDKGPDGKRVNMNRSWIIRDLIDEKWPS